MAAVTWLDEETLVELFKMRGGFVLDFSAYTFARFFDDHRVDIDNARYSREGTSKGRRMRAFLKLDPDHTVGKVINSLIAYGIEKALFDDLENAHALIEKGRRIATRLLDREAVVGRHRCSG